jgi:hypothetical protein
MLGFIASVIEAFFSSFWKGLFPAKTADAQRADDLGATNDALKSEATAAEDAPTSEMAMSEILKEHHL